MKRLAFLVIVCLVLTLTVGAISSSFIGYAVSRWTNAGGYLTTANGAAAGYVGAAVGAKYGGMFGGFVGAVGGAL